MYKVTNKMRDTRKFRDGDKGRDVFVESKKSVLTTRPPEEGQVWKVEKIEEIKEKKSKSKEGDVK